MRRCPARGRSSAALALLSCCLGVDETCCLGPLCNCAARAHKNRRTHALACFRVLAPFSRLGTDDCDPSQVPCVAHIQSELDATRYVMKTKGNLVSFALRRNATRVPQPRCCFCFSAHRGNRVLQCTLYHSSACRYLTTCDNERDGVHSTCNDLAFPP